MLAEIRRDGFHKVGVFSGDEEPNFSYTVGLLHTFKHPELVIFGLPIETEFAILDTVKDLIANGAIFASGSQSAQITDGAAIAFVTFDQRNYEEYLIQAQNFYRSNAFTVLMMVWPDSDGIYPWDPASGPWLRAQQPTLWSSGSAGGRQPGIRSDNGEARQN